MAETNVPGISSELILKIDKWMAPMRVALGETRTLGKELDANLAASSGKAGQALDKTGKGAGDLAKAAKAAADQVDALAKANSRVKPPPLPPPTNVINWTQGLKSLAGMAGTVSPALGQLNSGFMAVEGAAGAMGVGLTAALGPIALVVGALAGLKAAFSFGVEGVKLAADMEQTALSFEVMIGDADRAKATLIGLQKFADTTPFKFPEIASAGKLLLAMGIEAEDVTKALRMLGDVSSANNQPLGEMAYLFGQIKSQGFANTQDLRQFATRGVPIYDALTKAIGKTRAELDEMASSGQIGFAEIHAAFQSMTSEGGRYFGMTERQAMTLNGRLSTLSDAWDGIKRQVGESIMQGADLDGVVVSVSQTVERLAPLIVSAFENGVTVLAPFAQGLGTALSLIGEMSRMSENLTWMMDGAFGDSTAGKLEGMVLYMTPVIGQIKLMADALGAVVGWLERINFYAEAFRKMKAAEAAAEGGGSSSTASADQAAAATGSIGGAKRPPAAASPRPTIPTPTLTPPARTPPPRISTGAAERAATATGPRAGGGGPNINVTAPPIPIEALARAISGYLMPVIDSRIAAAAQAARLAGLGGQVRRGL